jgi:hypothetical protein
MMGRTYKDFDTTQHERERIKKNIKQAVKRYRKMKKQIRQISTQEPK